MALFFVWGCGNQTKTDMKDDHSGHQNHTPDSVGIKLNHGEKWLVNNEMKPFVQESEAILNEYLDKKKTDYQVLSMQLKEKNTGLIKSCTMDGESHEELHKWLHPHMELIKALEQEKDTEKAQTLIQDLKKSFETYHLYFQ